MKTKILKASSHNSQKLQIIVHFPPTNWLRMLKLLGLHGVQQFMSIPTDLYSAAVSIFKKSNFTFDANIVIEICNVNAFSRHSFGLKRIFANFFAFQMYDACIYLKLTGHILNENTLSSPLRNQVHTFRQPKDIFPTRF